MKTGIARWWTAACLLAALALPSTGIGNAEASQVDGTWVIRDLALHIFDCRHLVCGRIVGITDAARRQSQCGKTIVCLSIVEAIALCLVLINVKI